MTRDLFIKGLVSDTVCLNPAGFIANELNPEQFQEIHTVFFDSLKYRRL